MRGRKKHEEGWEKARMNVAENQKKKNVSSVTSPLSFPSSFSSSPLILDSSLSVPSIWPYVSSLLSSITSFCPPPHPSSPAPHPPPLLYTHSIIRETRLREMSGVGAIIITTSFCNTWVIAHRIGNRHLNHNQYSNISTERHGYRKSVPHLGGKHSPSDWDSSACLLIRIKINK